ncbi:isocitrate lyase/phosphoenolpyruvate mutase family protein [Paucibacter sp. AS339]|uniref:isocitrate lyase/PEP mutase family protein n=1 Tax=Paucibacter hankyongi TaxID=3133434 RepID=UPI00309A8F7D
MHATSSVSRFISLHHTPTPFLLPNAWDAASARLLQETGAAAVATSSAALAWSLGYADGGALPQDELLAAIRRIARVLQVPLSVDLENGYSDQPELVADLALAVANCGVAGINLEDGDGAPDLLVQKIRAIRQALGGRPFFINARCDVWLRALAQGQAAVVSTKDRLRLYREAGADGAFLPGLSDLEPLAPVAAFAAELQMPLNLMVLPNMPSIQALHAAGVQRFSVGPALFQACYGRLQQQAQRFVGHGDTTPLFEQSLDYGQLNGLFSG